MSDSLTSRSHTYTVHIHWTGNRGSGTSTYGAYRRSYQINAAHKPDISGSADPAFRGDPTSWNPEDLLVASLAACHQLWYLHLCAAAGIVVTAYQDQAQGFMTELEDGSGQFEQVTLRPTVTVTANADLAMHFHEKAHQACFIARSVNFPVHCLPTILT